MAKSDGMGSVNLMGMRKGTSRWYTATVYRQSRYKVAPSYTRTVFFATSIQTYVFVRSFREVAEHGV